MRRQITPVLQGSDCKRSSAQAHQLNRKPPFAVTTAGLLKKNRLREQFRCSFLVHTLTPNLQFAKPAENGYQKMKPHNNYLLISLCLAALSSPLGGRAAT